MAKKIVLFDAHPDPRSERYVHALAQSYANGAHEAGHELRMISLAALDFPLLRSRDEWMEEAAPDSVQPGQEAIRWADHLVFIYPLWHGDMPALLKAYLEHVMRPGFALDYGVQGGFPKKLLSGRSARLIVTMGMPAFFYRAYYAAHSVRSFKRNILVGCGVDPVSSSLIGNVEKSAEHRQRWLERIRAHGVEGD